MSDVVPAIEIRGLEKVFEEGQIRALNGVDLKVARGEFVAVMGPSGCGKSTLLHLIAALDRPSAGTIRINGLELTGRRDLSRYRAREVGLVFQLHNLLPSLTALENVQVPMFGVVHSGRDRAARARHLLQLVGLSGKERVRPTQLSGGERQRVAIARALANDPSILLADEPTGNLDSKAGTQMLDLMADIREQRRLTIVLVTHDRTVATRADRIVHMLDGRVVGEEELRARAPEAAPTVPTATPAV